jgi:putative membrane-bound dehydrogenase-like protein
MLPDGFTIEKVAGPPVVDRPIIADFDEQGRLYVASSSGSSEPVQKQLAQKPHSIVRLTDSKASGTFDQRTLYADHMMFPEGSMWYAGSLYVGAPPSIWKLTDTAGNGVADERSEWFTGKTLTGCANDIHGPYLGPDGWIYWCKGAFAEQSYARPGQKPFVTRAAHIFRARPDGSGIEPVMTGGMDNPVHVVFMPNGERLFTSTFVVNPGNGQRDGIIHAIYGGIYGKVHDVIDDHPHTSPDVMPVLVQLGPAAACGLARFESDVFGPDYRNNLFATSFNLHKVTRHILTPEGATFASKNQDFLLCDSLDFHPTDVIEDADGSLLVIDTGGWYKLCCPTSQLGKPDILGAIYRVRKTGAPHVEDPRGLKLDWPRLSPEILASLLDDPRPAVRRRAIQSMAEKGAAALPSLEQLLHSSSSPEARTGAVWTLSRIDDPKARQLSRTALHDSDETVRQAAAHSASVWRDHGALADLEQLLSNPSAFNRRVAAEALGRLRDQNAIESLVRQIGQTSDHILDHSLTYALIEINDPKATSAWQRSDNPRIRRAALIALEQMQNGSCVDSTIVESSVTASDSSLRDTAAWIAARHPQWGDALAKALGARLNDPGATDLERSKLREQLAKLSRSPAIQEMLAGKAADANLLAEPRRLALSAMAESGLEVAPQSWIDAIHSILAGSDAALLPDAIAVIQKLKINKDAGALLAAQLVDLGARETLPPQVRLEALAAAPAGLSQVSPGLTSFLIGQLSQTQPAGQQLLAAQVIQHARLSSEQLSALADAIRTAGPLEIGPVLDAFNQSTEPAIGARLAHSLKVARALTSLRAEVVRLHLARFGPDVEKQADALAAKLNPDAAQQKSRLDELLASLPRGEIRRGQLLFNSAKTACSSCHTIGYVGGHVGPDLTRVGAIRAERDLLESIIYPSASFVQSFEPTMVVTNSGDHQYGIVRRNDSQEVLLITGPNQKVRIARGDVKQMLPGTVSLMPAGLGDQLSPQELADLVAFLKACQ